MDASYQNGLTALAGGAQIGATPISRTNSRFTTAATAGDSALLPVASAGLSYFVKNAGAASMNMFPCSTAQGGAQIGGGDAINALANTAVALAAGKAALFICMVNGTWEMLLSN